MAAASSVKRRYTFPTPGDEPGLVVVHVGQRAEAVHFQLEDVIVVIESRVETI
jgi:hypothetical protein